MRYYYEQRDLYLEALAMHARAVGEALINAIVIVGGDKGHWYDYFADKAVEEALTS